MTPRFHVTKQESETIFRLADRALGISAMHQLGWKKIDLVMDLTAVHANGCRLQLERLLDADVSNFIHDICGIVRHIDRETGCLGGSFVPRCAEKVTLQ